MRIIIALLLIATQHAAAQGLVKLSGTITAPLSDSVTITYNDSRLAWFPKEYYAPVDAQGRFAFSFPLPAGSYVQAEIRHGNRLAELLLHAGDSLAMTVNTAHYDSSIHYEGRGAEIQNFVARHTIERGRMNQYTQKMKAAMNNTPANFLSAAAKEKAAETAFLDRSKNRLPAPFVTYWSAYYQYYTWFFMQQYPQMSEIFKKRRYTDTIPLANYSVVKEIPYAFNDEYLQVPSYLLYLTGIFDAKLRAAGLNVPAADTAGVRKLQDSVVALAFEKMSSQSAEYFIAQDLYGRAKYQPLARTRRIFSKFKKRWPVSEYMPLIDKQVALAEHLAPGQPAPDFDIVLADKTVMKLSDLKGKVVYLGFWATDCRQCVGEMITERKTKEILGNKPVAFVYVQMDDDTARASMLIGKYKMTGLFTRAVGSWSSTEAQLYGITGMPAYFLIDTEGKIAIQNPPTPMQSMELMIAISKLVP
ncbi:MAG: redoxin family protein [Bacteroidota bacterium]